MIVDMTAASVLSLLLPLGLRWDHLHGLSGDKLREEGGGKCCEAVLLHYIVNVYLYVGQCLQCFTLPVITFCLSLLNAIAGYFVFR